MIQNSGLKEKRIRIYSETRNNCEAIHDLVENDVCTKSQKMDPSLLSEKCPHLFNLPLFVRTHHTFRKIRSVLH